MFTGGNPGTGTIGTREKNGGFLMQLFESNQEERRYRPGGPKHGF